MPMQSYRTSWVIRLVPPALLMLSLVSSAAAQTVSRLSLSPTSVVGGASSTGTVYLSKKASAGGVTVSLSSSNSVAGVPTSLSIPSGKSSGTFSASTAAVAAAQLATIKAQLG